MNDALHASASADDGLRQVLDRTTAAALAVSGAAAGQVFEDLARSLATILGVDAALIGEFMDEGRTRMRTLAVWIDGRHLRNFDYDVTQTPCRYIVGRASRFVASGVHREFAPGSMFEAKGFDAYAGYSLFDAGERQVGLIVALNRAPLGDRDLTEALMKIFAVRAAAEIERRRAAAALQESEISYRALFEAAQDAIFVHDWDSGAIIDVNPRACEVYGYSREELLGASIAELSSNVPPYTAQDAARHIENAKRGQPVRIEWQRRNRDGSLHWDEVVLQPATIGGVPRILALTREITERKEAEAALRASEEQYRAIFNASADALVLWDSSFRRVDVNPAYEKTYGWKREEMVGRGYEHLDFSPDYFRPRQELVRRALAGENCRAELEAIRKDGERILTEVHAIPFRHRGEPHVLAIARDITERKRAEQALRDSEGLYRELFNASADAMVLRDAEFRVVDVNPSYTTMSGYSREETIGAGRVLTIDEAGNVQWRAAHQRMLSGEHLRFEFAARRKDGTPYEAEVRGMPVRYHDRPHVLYVSRDITERKRAERALAASEEQYRAIFNAATDALVLWNSNVQVVDVNPAFLRIYGYERERIVGGSYPASFPRDYVEQRAALVKRALAGEHCELQTRAFRADGQPFEVELRVLPVQHRGEPHALAIARDITVSKRAEEALRASEEQYRAIFNASADGLFLRDEQFRIVDVNPAYLAMKGFAREELLGSTRILSPADDEAERRHAHARVLAGETVRYETSALRKDGTWFDVEVRCMPLLYRGAPHVLYSVRDITERKRAEAALRASEEQYRAIFNASADAMVMRDDQMRVVDVNPAFLSLLGRAREEIVGHVHPAFVIAPEREAAEELLRRALAGRAGRLEVQSVSADGVRREIDVRAMPMQYQGRPHVLAIARDMTAERRAERESHRLEAQLRQAQKMEAIGQLTGGIAHDFNNILASVMGYAVLAEERAAEAGDAKAVDYLGQALASCRRARDLIQQMLTFSRGGRGEARVVDLAALVRDALPMLRASLPSTLRLVDDCDPATPTVRIDEVQAHQVLLNLAINARDAMSGAGELRIGVRRRDVEGSTCTSCRHTLAGTYVELSVSDCGGGIAPELLDRIFDPFFTTKAPGKGSGMGLSMVHGIVHEYGGHVIVDNVPGRGAVFRVLWPACAGRAESVASAPPRAIRQPLKGRVLLVDDEPAVLGSMRELLSTWGLEVAAFGQPEQALAAFEANADGFDLLVTDLAMPQLSGTELAARLQSRRDLPVLLASGFVDDAALAAARELGVHAVLRKPVEAAELRAAVESALRARATRGGGS